jgi:hypothetical protein
MLVEIGDEHAERRPPVADVVLPDHVRAGVPEQPGERISDDGRPQMPDVQLLGDVRARVFDDDTLAGKGRSDAETGGREAPSNLRPDRLRRDGQVDEAGSGELGAGNHLIVDDCGRNSCGKFARRRPSLARRRQGTVRLEIGVVGHADQRIGTEVPADPLRQLLRERVHGSPYERVSRT